MLAVRTILYPTDLSADAVMAFRLAAALARDYAARLVVLSVYPPPLTGAEAVDRTRPDGVADALLAQLRRLTPDDPAVRVEYRVAEGRPADVILAAADDTRADLIVMGTHGRTGLRRAVVGSVAEEVARRAACPVATVRAGAAVAEARGAPFPPADPGEVADAEAGPDHWHPRPPPVDDPVREVEIPAGGVTLRGALRWPHRPRGVVVFAHGSGSSRHSPRNRFVAEALTRAGFATLLLDLLTPGEEADRGNVFDTELLAARLAAAADWVADQPETTGLPVGYFGASTGSAAALTAAAARPDRVAAVVSRGGRPDLARAALPAVRAPTLLIVGGDDEPVLGWNRAALEEMTAPKQLAVVPGATHLFEEPGALDRVAALAGDWFDRHLTPVTAR